MRRLLALLGLACTASAKLYGINYNSRQGPDWDPNRCKSQAQIDADMMTIAAVSNRVRIFSLADCNQGYMVTTAARKVGLGVWLGMWVTGDQDSLNSELAALETLVADGVVDNTIEGIHVGSESLYRKDITADQAINYFAAVKTYLGTKNLTFPVSITDVIDTLLEFPQVISAVDVVMANAFPFWENADPDSAVVKFQIKYDSLVGAAGGKQVLVGETGWPSAGVNANASLASPANQATYAADFVAFASARQIKYFYFSAFDDTWKRAQEGIADTVEAHFGLFDPITGELKPDLEFLTLPLGNGKFSPAMPGSATTPPRTNTGGSGGSPGTTAVPQAPIPTSVAPKFAVELAVISLGLVMMLVE